MVVIVSAFIFSLPQISSYWKSLICHLKLTLNCRFYHWWIKMATAIAIAEKLWKFLRQLFNIVRISVICDHTIYFAPTNLVYPYNMFSDPLEQRILHMGFEVDYLLKLVVVIRSHNFTNFLFLIKVCLNTFFSKYFLPVLLYANETWNCVMGNLIADSQGIMGIWK